MVRRHLNMWSWLLLAALLMSLAGFAPLPDLLDTILVWVRMAILLAFVAAYWWEERRERKADQSSTAAVSAGDQV